MADKTSIEWTDATWNPIRARNRATGGMGHYCAHVSEGCRNCYSEAFQPRFKNPIRFAAQNLSKVEIVLDEHTLTQPLRWKRPRKIFVCSMTDLFGDWVTDDMLDRIFAVMALCPQHTFQIVTKRDNLMRDYLTPARAHPVGMAAFERTLISLGANPQSKVGSECILQGDIAHLQLWPLPNVWLGVSVEDQQTADKRIPTLLNTPAAIRFISAEPLLGPIDLGWALSRNPIEIAAGFLRRGRFAPGLEVIRRLDWVIAGGESGRNARPMHPDWARSLRDQCAAAGVAFLFKQWGKWREFDHGLGTGIEEIDADSQMAESIIACVPRKAWVTREGEVFKNLADLPDDETPCRLMEGIGKKAAGRTLDGRTHDEFPEVSI